MKDLNAIVESDWFRRTVITAILVNAVHIGLETDPAMVRHYGTALVVMDWAVLGLFSVEMILRFLAASSIQRFFADPWNIFDMIVIGAGFFPGSEFLTVFRLLRILRLMRTVRLLPGLKKIADGVFATLPSLVNVLIILFLIFYIYATAGTLLYRGILPEKFGSLGRSALTLCEVITLEGWADPMDKLLKQAPYAWFYFISFIILGSYLALSSIVQIFMRHMQNDEESNKLIEIRKTLARIESRLERGNR